jgi:exonuclease III
MIIKIATWNLCLGFLNKKDIVLDTLKRNKIDICCMQETELDTNVPTNVLDSKQYSFEPELNTNKKRVGIYIDKNINYHRRTNLEENNLHLIIIDIVLKIKIRIITLYRAFRPPDGSSPLDFFSRQISVLESNRTSRTIVLGNFNLDAVIEFRLDYQHKLVFNGLSDFKSKFNFEQFVHFPTWSRMIKMLKRNLP